MFSRIFAFFKKYERHVSPVTVVIGFIFDNLTLRRIDLLFSNVLLISYLVVSALSILLLNVHEARRGEKEPSERLHLILIFIMQFCLGGLFSASFLFYSKSGTIIGSWPFLLMLFAYIIGNEILRKKYVLLGFQISVFFTALFSFLIFFFPVIFGKMGDAMFLLSGIASLMVTGVFIYVVSWFAPERIRKSAPIFTISLLGLFVIINALYFTNLIPPIPLALKEAGIYRSLEKLPDGTYRTTGEEQHWFNFLSPAPTIHAGPGMSLYALTAIFAPANLSTNVVHAWEYLDESKGEWVTVSTINLSVFGGRENGFRTFSVKENVFPGKWRVDVKTPRGQIIGRLSFTISPVTGGEKLETKMW